MPRIPYADPSKVSPAIRDYMSQPGTINVTRMMANTCDAVFDGFNKFSGAFYHHSKLDPILREIAIIRAGAITNSPYSVFHHSAFGRVLGMTEPQIEASTRGGKHPGVLDEVQQAVLDFTDDVVKNVRAGDATLASVRKHLPDQQVLELTLVIGLYGMMARFLDTAGVEVDAAPLDWAAAGFGPKKKA
jgi:alkylhydroperoxidase family enzyme